MRWLQSGINTSLKQFHHNRRQGGVCCRAVALDAITFSWLAAEFMYRWECLIQWITYMTKVFHHIDAKSCKSNFFAIKQFSWICSCFSRNCAEISESKQTVLCRIWKNIRSYRPALLWQFLIIVAVDSVFSWNTKKVVRFDTQPQLQVDRWTYDRKILWSSGAGKVSDCWRSVMEV